MSQQKIRAAIARCFAACRDSSTPRTVFDEMMERFAASPDWTPDELARLRRSFIHQMMDYPSNESSRFHGPQHASEGFLDSPQVARYFIPCLARCLRSGEPFTVLTRALAELATDPTWSEKDITELRLRVSKAVIDFDIVFEPIVADTLSAKRSKTSSKSRASALPAGRHRRLISPPSLQELHELRREVQRLISAAEQAKPHGDHLQENHAQMLKRSRDLLRRLDLILNHDPSSA